MPSEKCERNIRFRSVFLVFSSKHMCFCANEGAACSKYAELHADAYVISRIYYEIYCFYAITKNMGSAYAHCKKGQGKRHGDEGSKGMCAKGGCVPGKVWRKTNGQDKTVFCKTIYGERRSFLHFLTVLKVFPPLFFARQCGRLRFVCFCVLRQNKRALKCGVFCSADGKTG